MIMDEWLFFQMVYEVRIKGWHFCYIYNLNSCQSLSTSAYSSVTLAPWSWWINSQGVCERRLKKPGLLPVCFNSTGTHNSTGKLKNVEISNNSAVTNRVIQHSFNKKISHLPQTLIITFISTDYFPVHICLGKRWKLFSYYTLLRWSVYK